MFAGDAVFPGEVHWGTYAQCLQGMPYSPVKFTGAPDAQCLQGMLYSPVKFTRCPIFAGIWMPSPTNYPASCIGMLCTTYTQILKVVYTYHICIEMYHEVLSLLQTILIMDVVYCMVGVNITLQNGVLTVATNSHRFWV